MKKSQIAVQLFTLRDYLTTPGAVDRSFARLRKIGFEAVQVSGTQVNPKEVKKAADANGLVICATHDSEEMIFNHTDSLIEKLSLYNCRHTAYPCPSDPTVIDYDAVIEFSEKLENAAQKLEKAGKCLSYHNHNVEFRRLNGEFILDIIYARAPHLKAEIDTYWVQMGGCNPADFVKKYAGRQEIFHLKDFGVASPRTATMFPVGSGNLNWEEIVPAAEEGGVQWFIIEQDLCLKDPFESLADSYHYLTDHFC